MLIAQIKKLDGSLWAEQWYLDSMFDPLPWISEKLAYHFDCEPEEIRLVERDPDTSETGLDEIRVRGRTVMLYDMRARELPGRDDVRL